MKSQNYFVITAGYSGLMAHFDHDGRLAGWTTSLKAASLFATHAEAADGVRSICRREFDAAVQSGRAVREVDPETDEVVVMDYSGRRARPMQTPAIKIDGSFRTLDVPTDGAGRTSVRAFVKAQFATARRNPTRQTEARISPQATADEYTMPASQRARLMARRSA